MNSITAAEALMRVAVSAAHGGDQDDGYAISNNDWLAISDVAKWLLAGAVERGLLPPITLPTVNADELLCLAAQQAYSRHGTGAAAARAMGVNPATFWRWRKKSEASGNAAGRGGTEAQQTNGED